MGILDKIVVVLLFLLTSPLGVLAVGALLWLFILLIVIFYFSLTVVIVFFIISSKREKKITNGTLVENKTATNIIKAVKIVLSIFSWILFSMFFAFRFNFILFSVVIIQFIITMALLKLGKRLNKTYVNIYLLLEPYILIIINSFISTLLQTLLY